MSKYCLLIDIDGVVVESPHEISWKQAAIEYSLINELFDFSEFYQKYVAGIPGLKGAEAILEELGYYKKKMIASQQEKENEAIIFRELKQKILEKNINEGNLKIFSDMISIIIEAKNNKIPIAAVSSSENAEKILKKTGVYELFDCHLLGAIKHKINDKEELYILALGKLLQKFNLNEIPIPIIFEDADKVIESLCNKNYIVIGIAREGLSTPESLKNKGAKLAYDSGTLKEKSCNGIIDDLEVC
jgi:beta-phosphoglucomutase-like phosphatase (HAD superfamily)